MDSLITVGTKKRGINVTLCEAGHAKLQRCAAKVQYRKAEGEVTVFQPKWGHREVLDLKRKPYIFARFIDPATGKTARPELGRWLLDSDLPVIHRNGNPLDFRVENLAPQETQRQKARRELAAARRAEREEKKANAASRRAAKKPVVPDGLTPEQQLAAAFDEGFQRSMRHVASSIVRDPMQRGTSEAPTDERRGDEVVSMVVNDSIEAIQAGRVKNVRGYLWVAMLTQARFEKRRKLAGLGDVRRPRKEDMTISELEERQPLTDETQDEEAA